MAILGFAFLKKDSFLLQQKRTWHLNLKDKGMIPSASLRVQDNRIYVSSYYSPLLLEIDRLSGSIKKEIRVGEHIMSSDLSDNTFYYSIIDKKNNYIHALDVSSGAEEWSQNIVSPEDRYAPTSIKAASGRVYLNEGLGKVSALDGENGEKLWSFEPKMLEAASSGDTPLVRASESVVLLGFGDGMVYALDPTSGTELWKFDTVVRSHPHNIFITDKITYVAASTYSITRGTGEKDIVYALDTKTGQKKWSFLTEGNPNTSITADGEIFYIAKAYGYLQAISNKDGKELWRLKTDHFPTNLSVSDGVLYFAINQYDEIFGDKSYLQAVDTKTGKKLWEFKIRDLVSDFDSANGTVYFIKRDGELTALK